MKLDVSSVSEHSEIVTALTWSPDGQLYSCGDDKIICKYGPDGALAGKITTLNVFITSISWFPSTGRQAQEMFAISCTDGTYRFISKSGREEKKISAHEGAVIIVDWSHDGSALLSAGEDGDLKIWSKSGNLRSTLLSVGQSLFAACWGPGDTNILVANGKQLIVKYIDDNKKTRQWNAHDATILCVDWNVSNSLIISGAEDCTYRVWDQFGRQLFSSRPMEQVITSISWSPNGENFAVGSFNIVRLCDKSGWTHCREKHTNGSLMDIMWTSDGTQFAGACSDGSVMLAQVVDRKIEWKNIEVTLLESRKIRVQDTANESLEDIEYARDRVVEMGIGFDHLVVTTSTQCYIYGLQNLNTPIIFDIKAPTHFLHLCRTHFLTLDLVAGLQIISYEGRTLCSPKFQGLRAEYLTRDMVALCPDCVGIVDTVDAKNVQILDATTARPLARIAHTCEIIGLQFNQHSLGIQERIIAVVDKNRDFFIASLNGGAFGMAQANQVLTLRKLHSHVESFVFNDETDVVVGTSDGRLNIWYAPMVAFLDKDLLVQTTLSMDASDLGRNANITSYTGNRITIRKVDGSVLYSSTSVDIPLLYELCRGGRWDESIRLCRHQKNNALWGILATFALNKKHLDTAETALCELNEVAKVEFIQNMKNIPSEEGKSAEMALFKRNADEAERILLQANPPLVYRAIKLNIQLYRWGRALDIAMKFKSHVDTVLAYRQKYLVDFGKSENLPKMVQIASQVTVDWEAITAKEEQEIVDEKKRGSGSRK